METIDYLQHPPTRETFAAFCRLLYDRELVVGVGGNVSARTKGGFLVTPSGLSLRDITPDKLLLVSEDSDLSGPDRPSKEFTMHLRVFKNRPDCNVVLHIHGHYLIAASTLLQPDLHTFPPLTPGFCCYAYPLAMLPFYVPGSKRLAEEVDRMFRGGEISALLLQNHGLITTGKTLADALNIAEEVDEAARIYLLTQGNGETIPERYISRIT